MRGTGPAIRRQLALGLPLVLLATLLHAPSGVAQSDDWDVAPQKEPSVPGVAAEPQPLPENQALLAAGDPPAPVRWPAAASAEVAVPAAGGTPPAPGRAGATPVSVGAADRKSVV